MIRWIPWWLWLAAAAAGAWLVYRSQQRVLIAVGIGMVLVLGGARSLYRRFGPRRIRDWRDAEQAAAVWLRKAGCRRVALTGGSADGGIDVLTAEWAVQVKHRSKRVGRPAVQQLVGAALTVERHPALFSTSGFSGPAIDYAVEHEVALFDLNLDGSAHGVTRTARRVGRRTRRLLR